MPSANLTSFPICIHFIALSFTLVLNQASHTMLSKNRQSGYLYLIPKFKRNILRHLPCRMISTLGLPYIAFVVLSYAPFVRLKGSSSSSNSKRQSKYPEMSSAQTVGESLVFRYKPAFPQELGNQFPSAKRNHSLYLKAGGTYSTYHDIKVHAGLQFPSASQVTCYTFQFCYEDNAGFIERMWQCSFLFFLRTNLRSAYVRCSLDTEWKVATTPFELRFPSVGGLWWLL